MPKVGTKIEKPDYHIAESNHELTKSNEFILFEARGRGNHANRKFLVLTEIRLKESNENRNVSLPVGGLHSLQGYHYIISCPIPKGLKLILPLMPVSITNSIGAGTRLTCTDDVFLMGPVEPNVILHNVLLKKTIHLIRDLTVADCVNHVGKFETAPIKNAASAFNSNKQIDLNPLQLFPKNAGKVIHLSSSSSSSGSSPMVIDGFQKELKTSKDLESSEESMQSVPSSQSSGFGLNIGLGGMANSNSSFGLQPTIKKPIDHSLQFKTDAQNLLKFIEQQKKLNSDKDISTEKPSFDFQDEKPFSHQLQSIRELATAWQNGQKHAVFEKATGSGKTNEIIYIFTAIFSDKNPHKMLFLVPHLNLIDQTIERFKKINNKIRINALRRKGETLSLKKTKILIENSDVLVGTIQTACSDNNQDLIPFHMFTIATIDEAHHSLSIKRAKFIRKTFMNSENGSSNHCRVLAFTATPKIDNGNRTVYELLGFKADGKDNPITPYSIQEAIKKGSNCPVVYCAIHPNDLQNENIKAEDAVIIRDSEPLNCSRRNKMVVDIVINSEDPVTKRSLREERTLVFTSNIAHSNAIADELNKLNLNLVDPDRRLQKNYEENAWKHYIAGKKANFQKSKQKEAAGFDESIYLNSWPETFRKVYGPFQISVSVHSQINSDERKKILFKFKELKGILVITNPHLLSTGYDDPSLSKLIIVGESTSETQLIQTAGRVLRCDPKNPNKIAYIFEINWGKRIGAKFFHESLSDYNTWLPQFQFPKEQVEQLRRQTLANAGGSFTQHNRIEIQGAQLKHAFQWEPWQIEDRSIESCVTSIDTAIARLKEKIQRLKENSFLKLLEGREPPKLANGAFNTEGNGVAREAMVVDSGNGNSASMSNSIQSRHSSPLNISDDVLEPGHKKLRLNSGASKIDDQEIYKEDLDTRKRKESHYDDKHPMDNSKKQEDSDTNRAISEKLKHARTILSGVSKIIGARKNQNQKEVKSQDEFIQIQELETIRNNKIKSLEQDLTNLLKRYELMNKKLSELIAQENQHGEDESLRGKTLDEMLKEIGTIEVELRKIKEKYNNLSKKSKKPLYDDNQIKDWLEAVQISNIFDLLMTNFDKQEKSFVLPAFEYMIKHSPDIIHDCDMEGSNALHYCTFNGYSQYLNLLLKTDIDLNAKNKFGNTPLHCLMLYLFEQNLSGLNVTILRNFIMNTKGKLDLSLRNNEGYTPREYFYKLLFDTVITNLKNRPRKEKTFTLIENAFILEEELEDLINNKYFPKCKSKRVTLLTRKVDIAYDMYSGTSNNDSTQVLFSNKAKKASHLSGLNMSVYESELKAIDEQLALLEPLSITPLSKKEIAMLCDTDVSNFEREDLRSPLQNDVFSNTLVNDQFKLDLDAGFKGDSMDYEFESTSTNSNGFKLTAL